VTKAQKFVYINIISLLYIASVECVDAVSCLCYRFRPTQVLFIFSSNYDRVGILGGTRSIF